jgi:hypothetical protein
MFDLPDDEYEALIKQRHAKAKSWPEITDRDRIHARVYLVNVIINLITIMGIYFFLNDPESLLMIIQFIIFMINVGLNFGSYMNSRSPYGKYDDKTTYPVYVCILAIIAAIVVLVLSILSLLLPANLIWVTVSCWSVWNWVLFFATKSTINCEEYNL